MVATLCAVALTASLVVLADATSYCSIKTCNPRTHTRCDYPNITPSSRCGHVESSVLTQEEIDEILNTHNVLRARVASGHETRGLGGGQPAATNLGPLKWDKELAEIAQTWADQCNFNHDRCRDTENSQVGQNIAERSSTGRYSATLGQLVQDWYDEVDKFHGSGVKAYKFDFETGHYTQLVWATTTHLGCGAIRYNADGKWNVTYLVCNYGPTGNWQGKSIYETR